MTEPTRSDVRSTTLQLPGMASVNTSSGADEDSRADRRGQTEHDVVGDVEGIGKVRGQMREAKP